MHQGPISFKRTHGTVSLKKLFPFFRFPDKRHQKSPKDTENQATFVQFQILQLQTFDVFSSREEVGSNNFYYSDLSNGFFLFMQRSSVSTIFYSPACAYREITIFPVHIIKKGVVTSTQGKKNDIGYFALEQMLRRRHFRYLRD